MWFRRDLRLNDNPALVRALADYDEVVPLFVVDPNLFDRSGLPRLTFMCDALNALDDSMGRALLYRYGDPVEVIPSFCDEFGIDAVVTARDFAPYGARRDRAVAERLEAAGRSGNSPQGRRHPVCRLHSVLEAVAVGGMVDAGRSA
jgi:deoxyribodipyrimidine photo-lyase